MPKYTFLDKKTKKRIDMDMPYSELEKFLNHNPNMEQVFRMNLVDPVGIGVSKPPVDFMKHVIGKVKTVPGADKDKLEKRWVIPREI